MDKDIETADRLREWAVNTPFVSQADKWVHRDKDNLSDTMPNQVYFADGSHAVWSMGDKDHDARWVVGDVAPKGENIGFKQDATKPRWSLLPSFPIAQVVKVLEFGAAKYKVDNWMHVGDARRRYYDATMRHIEAWWTGEKWDTESGLHHLAHAACCLLFLIWFDKDAD